jgi:hypothetical protein
LERFTGEELPGLFIELGTDYDSGRPPLENVNRALTEFKRGGKLELVVDAMKLVKPDVFDD